jgi:hypothetical protein
VRSASQVVSIVLHPLMMPTLGALCYFFLFPTATRIMEPVQMWLILGVIAASTLALPLLSVLIMLRFGKISTVYMEDKRERNWPLLQTAIVYAAAFYVLKAKTIPVFIPLFILGAIASMVIAMVINLRWKISLHMIGIGGFCGGLAALFILTQEGSPVYLSCAFILAGILGTARLLLEAHTSMQILAGFMLGFTIELGLALAVAG